MEIANNDDITYTKTLDNAYDSAGNRSRYFIDGNTMIIVVQADQPRWSTIIN